MTEEDVRRYFESISLKKRAALLREILTDMETRLSAVEERNATEYPTPIVPSSSEQEADIEFPDMSLHEITGGRHHEVHRLRLTDAAEQYRSLLLKYGYVRGMPDPKELAKRARDQDRPSQKKRRARSWAEWVTRDGNVPAPVRTHDWEAWVAKDDEKPQADAGPETGERNEA